MTAHENEAELLAAYSDAAALMLAAADDRPALDAVLRSLTYTDAAKLLIGALEVAGSLVTSGDKMPGATPRELLRTFIVGANDVSGEVSE